MKTEKFAHQADVGASGEFQAFEAVHRVELGGEGLGKSLDASAAGADQRAVNVEQDQAHHGQVSELTGCQVVGPSGYQVRPGRGEPACRLAFVGVRP